MRNGNLGGPMGALLGGGSYRTYEEWKRTFFPSITGGLFGSYRTYEEWKLFEGF